MALSIELDRDEPKTIGEWLEFLNVGLKAGATEETTVSEVTAWQDDSVIVGFKIEAPGTASSDPTEVRLPTWLVHDLLSVVRGVAESDGDVRGMEEGARIALQRTYGYLLTPSLGENPYSTSDDDDSD